MAIKKYLWLALIFGVFVGTRAHAQLINCPSGFTSSGACGVSTSGGAQTFWNQNALSGSKSVIIPTGCTHCGQSMNTQAQVNVQAFTATWTFTPNEWNGAFILQRNMNNQVSGGGCSGTNCTFSAGAGCEAGFYQAFNSSNVSGDHIFALIFADNYSDRTSGSGFTGSTVQIYQPQQSPCNPNDSQPWYWSTSKISTSPISLSNGSSINTCHQTVGGTCDTYTAKLVYDGTTLTLTMFNVTAGGACPGASCFTQAWNNINIPSIVGSNTAWLGLAGGTGNTPSAFPYTINSLVYTVTTPPSVPSFQTYTSATAAGTPHAAAPIFSPVAGSYSSTQSVTISSTTTGSYSCYILSATTPAIMPQTDQQNGCTVGTKYTTAVSVPSSQTLYAQAGTNAPANVSGTLLANSDLTVGVFTIGSTAAAPTASPVPGTYSSTQTVTLTTATGGATICYTIDGSTPLAATAGTCSHGTTYSGTISVATSLTIKAIATISGSTNSAVQSFAYTITPSCTLAPNYQSVSNLPGFGFTAMAGQIITPNITQSGCPSISITNIGVSGGVISGTYTGPTLTVGKKLVITTQNSFPYQQLSNTVTQIATATSSTFTTVPISSLISIGSGAVTMNAIEVSLVNYSVSNTIGSITGTLGCTTNCGSAVTLTVGSTPTTGSCSYTGSGPTFTGVTSTQTLTITATAVDGGATTTIPVYVCSAPILPQIAGDLYYQNYVGQLRHLTSFVWGTTNQQVTWSKSGPCTLSNTTGSRDVVVTTTGTGYCTVTVTSVADATKNQTATIYIPSALPSYGDVTPVFTESLPCATDANLTGNLFTVGAGKTYATIGAVPWSNPALMVPGSTVQIFNTASGTGQSSFTEGWQIVYGGTSGQPIHVCGVPNAAGYPPIIEASGAVFPSWTSTFAAGFGLVNFQFNNGSLGTSCFGYYPSPSCGPNYILFSGFQIQDVVGPNTWSISGGGSGTWGSGADGINVRQGSYITLDSNLIINSEQGVGTYNNANSGWAGMTQMVDVSRPVCNQCGGRSGDSTSHPAYLQSYGMFYHEFIIGNAPTGDSGSCIKDRNIGSVIEGGYCGTGYSRYFDRVEDQDSFQYTDVSFYAQEGFPAAGDAWGVNGVTQFQYQLYTDVAPYSVFNNSTSVSFTPFHMLADHDNNLGGYGMNSFYGHLWFSFNTYFGPGELFDQHNVFGDNYFLSATAHSQNNIFWLPPATPCQMAYQSDAITNVAISNDLWLTGQINSTAPIVGDHFNFFSSDLLCGWVGDGSPNNYWGNRPLDSHVSGQGTLVFTATQPFTSGTFALPSGSAAIGAATTLTGEAALFPRRFNAISTNGVLTVATTMTDIGAVISGSTPPPVTNTTLHGTVTLRGTVQ